MAVPFHRCWVLARISKGFISRFHYLLFCHTFRNDSGFATNICNNFELEIAHADRGFVPFVELFSSSPQFLFFLAAGYHTVSYNKYCLRRKSPLKTKNLISKCKLKKQQSEIKDGSEQQVAHFPEHGHFIHGPTIKVKVYRHEQIALKNLPCFIDKLITRELNQDFEIYQDSKIGSAFILSLLSGGGQWVFTLEQSLRFCTNATLN